jgi:hypothetical protein
MLQRRLQQLSKAGRCGDQHVANHHLEARKHELGRLKSREFALAFIAMYFTLDLQAADGEGAGLDQDLVIVFTASISAGKRATKGTWGLLQSCAASSAFLEEIL